MYNFRCIQILNNEFVILLENLPDFSHMYVLRHKNNCIILDKIDVQSTLEPRFLMVVDTS